MTAKHVRTILLGAIALVLGLLAWSYYKSRRAAQAAAAAQALTNASAPTPTATTSLGGIGLVDQFLGALPGLNLGA